MQATDDERIRPVRRDICKSLHQVGLSRTTWTLGNHGEGQMSAQLLEVCWAAAVTLGLYAFHCYWEASRADLASSFRHPVPGLPGSSSPTGPGGAAYRARGRWAGLGAVVLVLGCLISVL
jgi:hypothetical protein